ncbi:hypothetical protein B0H14DRAFT_3477608 [Mycena olivaceomarginata]|nr:hypothetical protein B0H14DRAFT_3477608 [Mycena olivaceomarginata]
MSAASTFNAGAVAWRSTAELLCMSYRSGAEVSGLRCTKSDDADNLEQLLRNSWYPATVTDPGTCATFRSLEAYRLYSVIGNMNVRDFVTSMERMTDTTACSGLTWLPDRYKQFQRMARQWAFLKQLKRSGRGHDPAGDRYKQFQRMARQWAFLKRLKRSGCGHNPAGVDNTRLEKWRDVAPTYQFLYMLLLAVDANFRLKNRMRANEIDNPPLGLGWGYWVEPTKYREHLKNYVHEKDGCACLGWVASFAPDTNACGQTGSVTSKRGERYANMDFVVMAALAGFSLLMLTLLYDIAYQWQVNLPSRIVKLPGEMRLPLDSIKLQCALPVWHAVLHNEDCQSTNSLSFKEGVGKMDGEGVERSALRRKLIVALEECETQVHAFEIVNETVDCEVKKEWKGMIRTWLNNSSAPNPYTLHRKGESPGKAKVRLELRRDDAALAAAGKAPLHGRSAMVFLSAGIQIEDTQQRILAELAGTALLAPDCENKIQEWRHTLLVKIASFRTLQNIYMPGAAVAIKEAEGDRDGNEAPPKLESINLWMPSRMAADDVSRGCVAGLVDMEVKLCVAQCQNALSTLCSRLHAKRFLIAYRNQNVTGQKRSTKAAVLIHQVGDRVEAVAKRYRRGREALVGLGVADEHPHLRPLRVDDVRLDGDAGETDVAARKKLAMIGAGHSARTPRNAPGTSKRKMSWIWTAPGAFDDEEMRLHESIRVEWCHARARKVRWSEEIMLLREEMRRVLRYLAWQGAWWQACVALRSDLTGRIAAGVQAYALKQADWHDRLSEFFCTKWDVPVTSVPAEEETMGLDGLFEGGRSAGFGNVGNSVLGTAQDDSGQQYTTTNERRSFPGWDSCEQAVGRVAGVNNDDSAVRRWNAEHASASEADHGHGAVLQGCAAG